MSKVRLTGSTSGYTEIQASAVAGDNTLSLPTTTDGTLVATDTNGEISVSGGNIGGFDVNASAGANSVNLDASGRLLVGTSSTSSTTSLLLSGNSFSSTSYGALRFARGTTSPADDDTLGYIVFGDSGHTDAATIKASRNGGTWTSGSSQPTKLTFSTTADGASSPTERMRISRGGSAGFFCDTSFDVINLASSETAGSARWFIYATYGASAINTGTQSFGVYTNGNVVNTNNSYGSLSDIKLKENIVDANSQWNDLKALQVRNYNFKEGQIHTQIGLIAQEVELVSPGLVSETSDRDAEGNDLGTVTKSVNYSVLYMKAVKALQEAIERIETLEAANTDLAARITALEAN